MFSTQMDTVFYFLLLALITTTITLSSTTTKDKKTRKVAQDLQNGRRSILAMGTIAPSTALTLFISGLNGKADFGGGYRVDVVENDNENKGVFRLNSDSLFQLKVNYSEAVNSAPLSTDVATMFLAFDSMGTSLVAITTTGKATAFNLVSHGPFVPLPVGGSSVGGEICYAKGAVHLSSSADDGFLTYYVIYAREKVGAGNEVARFKLQGDSVAMVNACNFVSSLGHLCVQPSDDKTIRLESSSSTVSCSSNVLDMDRLVSGYVSKRTVYLVESTNTVFTFDRNLLNGGGGGFTSLHKFKSEMAWNGPQLPSFNNQSLKQNDTQDPNHTASIVIASVTFVVLILISIISCIIYSIQYKERKKFEEEQRQEKSIKERTQIAKLLGLIPNQQSYSFSSNNESNASDAAEVEEMQKWKRKKLFLMAKKIQKEEVASSKENSGVYQIFQTEKKKMVQKKSEYLKVKSKLKSKSQTASILKRKLTGNFKIKQVKMKSKSSGGSAFKSKSRLKLKRKVSLKLNKVDPLKSKQQSKQFKSSIKVGKVGTSSSRLKTKLMANKSLCKSKSKSRRQMSTKWQKAKSSKQNFSM